MARTETLTGNTRISVRRRFFKSSIVIELEWLIEGTSGYDPHDFREAPFSFKTWRDATVDDFANGRVQIGVLK